MKIFVKTLKGTSFEIEVNPTDTITDVKKAIETNNAELYPAPQQMLIHQGKILKDETTLEENSVLENSFIVIMMSKGIPAQAEIPAVAQAPAAAGQAANPLAQPQQEAAPVPPTNHSLNDFGVMSMII